MEISKSTPYVRYRENISSTLHKGTIHIESEYLDRERKTTIESIEGQTWQNMVNGENKEEEILPKLGLKIEGNEDVLDTVEQHMSIDTIIGDVEPVANEDGTYTYEISTTEGSYAKTLDGENNFSLTSDGLVGDMYIKYNAQGEEVNGNIVMNNGQSSYTIENSNNGEIKSAILSGQTLVNIMKKIDKMDVHQSRKDDDTYIEGNYFVFDLNKTDVDVAQNRYMQKDNPTTYPLEQGKTYTLLINIEENISSLSSHTFMSVIVKFTDGSSRALNIKGDGSVGIQKIKFQAVLPEITTLFVYYYPNTEVSSGKIRVS